MKELIFRVVSIVLITGSFFLSITFDRGVYLSTSRADDLDPVQISETAPAPSMPLPPPPRTGNFLPVLPQPDPRQEGHIAVPGPSAPVPAAPSSNAAIPPVATGSLSQPPSARHVSRSSPVSLNFDDADVYQVLHTIFGDVLRVNYIVDSRVKGRVTFRSVTPIAPDQILPIMGVILRLNGIGIVEDKGLYRVLPIGDISKEPAPVGYGRDPGKIPVTGTSLVHLIPIVYLQSSEVVKLITPFLSTNAIVIDVPRGNQIIVVDTDANVKRLVELVQVFDGEQFKRRKGEVYVYPVQNSKAKDVASLLQQIFLGAGARTSGQAGTPQTPGRQPQASTVIPGTAGFISDGTRIFYDDITNSIVVVATPEDYDLIKETIQKIDIVPRQVVIEGVVAQITLTDNLSLGVAWSLKSTFKVRGSSFSGTTALSPTSLQVDPKNLSGSGFTFAGVDDQGSVRALISALASESKAKLLAAPHILVADNRQARIQVGQQVPIPTAETFGTPGVAPQRVIQYKDIGIILKVKPQVNESGLVAMEIDQEVSTFSTLKLYTDSTEIILQKSQATTNLVVQDGETIIIGGLIREDTSKAQSGIPWLQKVPIIGLAFGGRSVDTTRQEIIILLTPHVIKSPQQAKDVTKGIINKFTDQGSVSEKELMKGTSDRQPYLMK